MNEMDHSKVFILLEKIFLVSSKKAASISQGEGV